MSQVFFPPVELSPDKNYVLGLVELLTFNSVLNIDEDNNQFNIFNTEKLEENKIVYSDSEAITLPTGSYEIEDIESYFNKH